MAEACQGNGDVSVRDVVHVKQSTLRDTVMENRDYLPLRDSRLCMVLGQGTCSKGD